ncbi:stage II sporulation protein M [Methanobrevibacter sp.]|uniref:stage II sporulation protein M n=1 Tax=Methanobrevibacter sp. TaxID=66852 RepID=UPI0025F057F2|nr:stage II sporulation protein M [Methanobrevibacter sp.]MBR4447100.1 stage II sporulation protein M [Methanobrevibacter sp.]
MLNEVKLAFSENKLAIISAIAILFISLILGYFLEPYLHSFLDPLVDDLTHKVQTGVIKLTFQSIFFNNIQIVFAMFIYGLFLCLSAVILAFNGFFVGYYVATTDNLFQTLLLIIPHGIFEFSSCIIACASGFVLFNFLYKFLKTLNDQENGPVKELLSISFNASSEKLKQAIILLIIASILMAIAGFVEAYLTLPIANFINSI